MTASRGADFHSKTRKQKKRNRTSKAIRKGAIQGRISLQRTVIFSQRTVIFSEALILRNILILGIPKSILSSFRGYKRVLALHSFSVFVYSRSAFGTEVVRFSSFLTFIIASFKFVFTVITLDFKNLIMVHVILLLRFAMLI